MKTPLLEYLDKLEATAKRDTAYCVHPARCSEHHEVPVQLALIAKLREAVDIVREAVDIALHHPPADVVNRFQDSVISWASIEVPE